MDSLISAYQQASKIAIAQKQTVGEGNNYYITLQQLEAILMSQE